MSKNNTRREVQKPLSIVSDLDKIVSEILPFKLHGQVHYLKPITAEKFFRYSIALEKMQELEQSTNPSDLIDAYYELVLSMVDTITRKDIEDCTQAQISGIFRLIIDSVTGYQKDQPEKVLIRGQVEKKKPHSMRRNWFQKFASFITIGQKRR